MIGELMTHFIWDVVKEICLSIPKAIGNYKFKNFFGQKAIKGDKVYVVLDPYEHPISRTKLQKGENRFIKNFHGKKPNTPLVGEDKILGSCSIRVTKYSTSEFALFRQNTNPVQTVLDESVINNWDGTFISFGSSDSNIKTFEIEALPENNLYKFDFGQNGYRCFKIGKDNYSVDSKSDVGILMRMQNPYHDKHNLFVCAGIGEWGTSGSAYYLFKNWKNLYKRFGSKTNFALIIQVNVGSDESAKEIREFKI